MKLDYATIKKALESNRDLAKKNAEIINRDDHTYTSRAEARSLANATAALFENLLSVLEFLQERDTELSRRLADLEEQRVGR